MKKDRARLKGPRHQRSQEVEQDATHAELWQPWEQVSCCEILPLPLDQVVEVADEGCEAPTAVQEEAARSWSWSRLLVQMPRRDESPLAAGQEKIAHMAAVEPGAACAANR